MTKRLPVRAVVLARDLCLAVVVVVVLVPLRWLPWSVACALGRWCGTAAYVVWPPVRRVGRINLQRAYGRALSPSRAGRDVRAVCASLGQAIAEGFQFSRRFGRGERGWRDLFESEDPDLAAALLADPRAKICVTAHLGSWEMAIAAAAFFIGGPSAVILRRIDNPFLDAFVRWIRFPKNAQWIEKRGAAAEALQRLRRGEHVALLADENAGRRGLFVDFFGRPASTTKLPALLALLTGAPIVCGVAVRRPTTPTLLYRVACIEPGAFAHLGDDAPRALTQAMVSTFERWIRETPTQWRWIHWRWRSRPDGTKEEYSRRVIRDMEFTLRS